MSFGLLAKPEPAPQSNRTTERTAMNTVLGMLIMMPVVFAVGGYALVSRRP
ncbi:hypothetical protein [Mycolicibacterium holsaticum]|uniref:hypothetical protein n=1 Tax=Mycolicibacterium holsaticum TaxID=152142 RepID=UPI001C7CA20D|nr:hypothetical protein [Mycolicibacterium holsaticum]QZA15575.1 hypothetical protein K3U96_02420 [Mycolicibacterium holsaticum DSM 44478 = JCM 12374]UNC12714.1 hypothetical protein H5U41_24400 [Mycolicibacterium holsaticum DSM 44478 = JCM 12374]